MSKETFLKYTDKEKAFLLKLYVMGIINIDFGGTSDVWCRYYSRTTLCNNV